jgi:predicted component of type VI protein secretion system
MALELSISGPGLDVRRRLQRGEPALIIGRDMDCAVCLPDPERNISRRHLSVWNDADELHFHVLSVVNGVDAAAGALPPGARGVLATGDMLRLSGFRISVQPVPDLLDEAAAPRDAWSEFARAAAQLVPDNSAETVPGTADADPFGDWGFQSTFGAGAAGNALDGNAQQAAADLHPFFVGLGMDGSQSMTNGELEMLGRLTRIAMQGLLQAAQAAAAARKEDAAGERTLTQGSEFNPLRMDTPLDAKLSYLFGGEAAAAGLLSPDRALAQIASELVAHQQAMPDAVLEVIQKLLEEFEPEALKKRLLGGSTRMFESARAWDAFVRYYGEQLGANPGWTQQLLDRHFVRAYARALVRAKRNTPGRS